jgi:hypothetical protein
MTTMPGGAAAPLSSPRSQSAESRVRYNGDEDDDDDSEEAAPRTARARVMDDKSDKVAIADVASKKHGLGAAERQQRQPQPSEGHDRRSADDGYPTTDSISSTSAPGIASRDPRDCVEVSSRAFTLGGYAVCIVVAVALLIFVATNVVTWCDEQFGRFWLVLGLAAAFDVALLQPLFVAAVYLWRWLTSDDSGDDGGATVIMHETHPIHGQWRYEGSLHLLDDVVDEAALEKPQAASEEGSERERSAKL